MILLLHKNKNKCFNAQRCCGRITRHNIMKQLLDTNPDLYISRCFGNLWWALWCELNMQVFALGMSQSALLQHAPARVTHSPRRCFCTANCTRQRCAAPFSTFPYVRSFIGRRLNICKNVSGTCGSMWAEVCLRCNIKPYIHLVRYASLLPGWCLCLKVKRHKSCKSRLCHNAYLWRW